MASVAEVPDELDLPALRGFTMRGWDFSRREVEQAIAAHRLLNPALELASNVCPWNCSFCFTESPSNLQGRKRRLQREMSLEKRLALVDQVAALGARSVNFVGAGEPTIDPDFFTLLARIADHGMTPIVYTEASLKLQNRKFVSRLDEIGATVVVKVNSLDNEAYQDAIVAGVTGRKPSLGRSYTSGRNRAIEVLIEQGFTDSNPTRLAFDTIACRQNLHEIEDLHRYARMRNIFLLLVNFLPSGRSDLGHFDALSRQEQFALFERLARLDEEEFGLIHRSHFPYGGGVPCTIRGLGLFVKIEGQVFDCPGEGQFLGHLERDLLADIWKKARPITSTFNGGCLPRDQFWAESSAKGRRLPVLG